MKSLMSFALFYRFKTYFCPAVVLGELKVLGPSISKLTAPNSMQHPCSCWWGIHDGGLFNMATFIEVC